MHRVKSIAGFCSIYDDTVGLGGDVQGGAKPSNWQMHIVKVMKEVIHSHRAKRLHADRHSFTLTQANYIHTCMCTQTQASTGKATGSCAPFTLIQLHRRHSHRPAYGRSCDEKKQWDRKFVIYSKSLLRLCCTYSCWITLNHHCASSTQTVGCRQSSTECVCQQNPFF